MCPAPVTGDPQVQLVCPRPTARPQRPSVLPTRPHHGPSRGARSNASPYARTTRPGPRWPPKRSSPCARRPPGAAYGPILVFKFHPNGDQNPSSTRCRYANTPKVSQVRTATSRKISGCVNGGWQSTPFRRVDTGSVFRRRGQAAARSGLGSGVATQIGRYANGGRDVTQTTPGGFRPPQQPHHHLCTHLDRLTSPEIRTASELAIDTGQPAEPPSAEPRPRYHDQDRITTTTTSSPTPRTAPLNTISWPPSTHPDPRQPR